MAGKSKEVVQSPFEKAITKIPHLSEHFRKGLIALGSNSKFLRASDTRLLEGSADLDNALKSEYPNAPRWDYAIGYNGKAFFVEIHPACSFDKMTEVFAKAEWVRNWVKTEAIELSNLDPTGMLYWIPTDKVVFPPNSPQRKKLALKKIVLTKRPFQLD